MVLIWLFARTWVVPMPIEYRPRRLCLRSKHEPLILLVSIGKCAVRERTNPASTSADVGFTNATGSCVRQSIVSEVRSSGNVAEDQLTPCDHGSLAPYSLRPLEIA